MPSFLQALERLGEGVNGWTRAMQRIAELPEISSKVRSAFLDQWGEHKWLSYRARNDNVVARGLCALLPSSNYLGPPLLLYRGAEACEEQPQGCGVSWTRRLPIARMYARRNCDSDGSVVFETIAPPHAIIHQRKYRDDPITEKWVPVSRLREALGRSPLLEASAGEARSEKIMLHEKDRAG